MLVPHLRYGWMSSKRSNPTRSLPVALLSTISPRSLIRPTTDVRLQQTYCLNYSEPMAHRHGHMESQVRQFASGSAGTPSSLGGFSYPAPRKLSDVAKLQLLERHGTERVTEIWNDYHATHKTAFADVLTDTAYNLFRNRTSRCPLFVIPVPRQAGFFTLLVQFQGRHCLLTFLDDYKQNAQHASPYLTITLFEELLQSKHIALVRADVTNMITMSEAKM